MMDSFLVSGSLSSVDESALGVQSVDEETEGSSEAVASEGDHDDDNDETVAAIFALSIGVLGKCAMLITSLYFTLCLLCFSAYLT